MKRAFTLLEVLAVTAIAAILTAITVPVYRRVIHSAHIQASLSNLHQIHIALTQYRTDWDGDARYGDLATMGLPTAEQLYFPLKLLETPTEIWKSPCGVHPDEPDSVIQYLYWPGDGDDPFPAWSEAYRENLVLVSDSYCTPHDVPLFNIYQSRRGLGVLLSGQLVNRFKPGDMNDPGWWSSPPP